MSYIVRFSFASQTEGDMVALLVDSSDWVPLHSGFGQATDTFVPLVTKLYNLITTKGQLLSASGKVIVCLASQWPCVTEIRSGVFTYGPKGG